MAINKSTATYRCLIEGYLIWSINMINIIKQLCYFQVSKIPFIFTPSIKPIKTFPGLWAIWRNVSHSSVLKVDFPYWYLIKGSACSLLLITILMDSWTDFDSTVVEMTWLVRNLTGCGENYLTVGWIDLIIGSFHSFSIFSHNIRS